MTELDSTIDRVMNKDKPQELPAKAPEKEPTNAILLWTLVIVGGLIIAIFVIAAFNEPDVPERPKGVFIEYNNFEFEFYDGLWWSLWARDDLEFILSLRYNPVQTLNITVSGEVSDTFERDTIYVTFDPTKEKQAYVALAATELSLNLARAMGVNVLAACTMNETEACASRPIITCDSENVSVIHIEETNGTANVILDGDCITLQGKELELTRAVDRIVYTFYGIITSLDP